MHPYRSGRLFSLTSGEWPITIIDVINVILSKLGLFSGAYQAVEYNHCLGRQAAPLAGCAAGGIFSRGRGHHHAGTVQKSYGKPGVMGIDSGAALGAVLVNIPGLGVRSLWPCPFLP